MAEPKEDLLSLGHLTSVERNTFTKQREHSVKKSRVTQLQQRWKELNERERAAQQHNKLILQQFEKAQGMLREMLAHNAAMKTIRMEYERYLEESCPRWQQQLNERKQVAQRKCEKDFVQQRMDDYLRSCLKNTEGVSSADQPLLPQGSTTKPQQLNASRENNCQNSHSNQDGAFHLSYIQPSWLIHPQCQTDRLPMRVPYQSQGSSYVPPSHLSPPILTYPHPFQLRNLTSTPGHHPPCPRLDPSDWGSLQTDCPWTTGAAGMPSGSEALFYMEEPPPKSRVSQVMREETEMSRAPSSRRERGGGGKSSHLSQELDIKPVRLSSGHPESSKSGRDSSEGSRKKRKKRGRSQQTLFERERHRSQESSTTSSDKIIASVAVVQSSGSDDSEKRSTSGSRRTGQTTGGQVAESQRVETVAKEKTRHKGKKSQSTPVKSASQAEESSSDNVEDSSPDDKTESCREGSGGAGIQHENRVEEKVKQVSSSSDRSSAEEDDHDINEEEQEKDPESGDGNNAGEKENSQIDRNLEVDIDKEKDSSLREEQEDGEVEEDNEVSARNNTTEEETGTEDEVEEQECEDLGDDEDRLRNEECEKRKMSGSSQDHECEGDEDKTDEDEEGSDEEEQNSEKAEPEDKQDSEDSSISPQDNGSKKMHIIPEEAAENMNKKGKKSGSSASNDIENLLTSREQTRQKDRKDPRADQKPKVFCDSVKIFQVELDRSAKTNTESDSDDFYD